jgi:hypothetical protein
MGWWDRCNATQSSSWHDYDQLLTYLPFKNSRISDVNTTLAVAPWSNHRVLPCLVLRHPPFPPPHQKTPSQSSAIILPALLMSYYARSLRTTNVNFLYSISPTAILLSSIPSLSQRFYPSFIRAYVSGQPRQPSYQRLKIWPIVLITVVGSASYVYMVKSRLNSDGPKKPRGPTITPP